jgi:GNAT superfamily N-acetyltransferase
MRIADLAPVIAATWPPAATVMAGPFCVPDGAGGGQRVSAARLSDPAAGDATEAQIDAARGALADLGQAPLFMVLDHQSALDARLAARGWRRRDATLALVADAAALAAPPPPVTCFAPWPPLAIQAEIWAAGGIGDARRAVMDRAAPPKTTLFGRIADRPAGTAFAAIHGDTAMIHALEVLPRFRRKGLAAIMVRTAADWAAAQGAARIATLVTAGNGAARGLYASLGFDAVGQYHYRTPSD